MKRSYEAEAMNDEAKTVHHSSHRAHSLSFIPQPSALIPFIVWLMTAALVLFFVSLIIVAPVALAHGYNSSAFVLYEMFRRVCHQVPERGFYLDGHPFAVCARCTGIYFGFAAGVLLYPLARSLRRGDAPARKWLLVALMPALVDFALGVFHVWENTHLSRSLTGAILGAVGAFYVVPGLMDLSRMRFRPAKVSFEGVLRDE
jgi:uncharacterized membrane protein